MNRAKPTAVRRPSAAAKPSGHPPPGDFIALGSKGQTTESKTASTLLKPAPSSLPSERKRDAAAALAVPWDAWLRPQWQRNVPSLPRLRNRLWSRLKVRSGLLNITPVPGVVRTGAHGTASGEGRPVREPQREIEPERLDGILTGSAGCWRRNHRGEARVLERGPVLGEQGTRWPEPRRRTGLEQCFGSRVRPSVQGPPLAAGAGQEWKRLRGRVLTQATVLCADGCALVLFYHRVTARKGGFEGWMEYDYEKHVQNNNPVAWGPREAASARSCPPDRAPSPRPVPPAVLLDEIEAAELEGNDDRLEGVLCGAVKQLKVTRAKPDSTLYLSLMYLAKIKPNIFATEGVIEAKGNSLVSVLACNLLMAAYEEDENWPEIFVKVYIEDSLGERIWTLQEAHLEALRSFQNQMAAIQRDAVWWLHTVVPSVSKLAPRDYAHWYDPRSPARGAAAAWSAWRPVTALTTEPETYYKWDNWPPESDRNFFLRLCSEVPILEDTLMRILVIGLSRELPLGPADAMELADHLMLASRVCERIHGVFWTTAWPLLLVVAAFNPENIGSSCLVPSNYSYPPCTLTDEETRTEMVTRELQVSQREKQEILAFEGHLAAASTKQTITESSSLLLSQLTSLEPQYALRGARGQAWAGRGGRGRRVLAAVLALRAAGPRNPDFLLNIIQRQGYQWLLRDLPRLPLFDSESGAGAGACIPPRAGEALGAEHVPVFYFVLLFSGRLCSDLATPLAGLCVWGPSVRHRPAARCRGVVVVQSGRGVGAAFRGDGAVGQARLEEGPAPSDAVLPQDVARLIVERSTIMSHLFSKRSCSAESDAVLAALLSIFSRYVQRMRKSKEGEEVYSWSESQDQVFLRWTSGETATMHILVVHAMVILLTLGPPRGEQPAGGGAWVSRGAGDGEFQALLDIWFPEKKPLPTAFLVDTSEEALLLPDWLKPRASSEKRCWRRNEDQVVQEFGGEEEGLGPRSWFWDAEWPWAACGKEEGHPDLEPQQLLLFVQSFGIPVSSMSKLLQYLDQAVAHDPQTLEQNIMDKSESRGPRPSTPGPPCGCGRAARLWIFPLSPSPRWQSSSARPVALALQQALGRELARVRQGSPEVPGVAVRLLQALATLLNSPHGGALVMVMHQNHFLACPLMRQLCQYQRCVPQDTGFSSRFLKVLVQTLQWLDSPAVEAGPLQAQLKLFAAQSPHLEELLAALFSAASAFPASGPVAVMLDPEVISSCPDLQQRLLFSQSKGKGPPGPQVPSFRPYLLALLTHQSGWPTLHQCIHVLLGKSQEERFDPSASLDFLWACIHIPRIWQGRDQRTPQAELIGLVELILAEAETRSQDGDASACSLLQARLPLLLSCCRGDDEGIRKVARARQGAGGPGSDHPRPSQLDALIHRFITLLADTSDSRAAENRVADANMAWGAVGLPALLSPPAAAPAHGALLASHLWHGPHGEPCSPSDLSFDSSDLVMLKSLLAGLSLPSRDGRADRGLDEEGEDESSAGPLPLVSISLFTPLTAAEMAPYVKRLSRGQTVEGKFGGLAPPGPVGPATSLQRLMSSAEESCRGLAFSLALRSIQSNP
ncbi:hypothetical protein E2I00_001896, partial [Balaenoptera physalus]